MESTTNSSNGYTFKAPGIGVQIDAYTAPRLALREVRAYTTNLSGKIKTIIDAAVSEPRQNKATKDLVHAAIWSAYDEVMRWAYSQTDSTASQFPFSAPDLPVSI